MFGCTAAVIFVAGIDDAVIAEELRECVDNLGIPRSFRPESLLYLA